MNDVNKLADALRSGTATPDQIETAAGMLTRWAELLADVEALSAYRAHFVVLLAKLYCDMEENGL